MWNIFKNKLNTHTHGYREQIGGYQNQRVGRKSERSEGGQKLQTSSYKISPGV